MHIAVSPNPVAAMLATLALSVAALRALQRSFTRPRTGLLPEITATGALQFIEQLVIFRAKDWLGFGGRRHNCGHSAGKRNCRSSACEPLEEPSPREIPIMLLHTPMLTDVFQWILPGNQTRNYLDSVHALYIIAGNSQICILKA